MLPIQKMISDFNHYDGNNIQYIILHYTGNSTDTAYNNARYFSGGNRNASAHYFVDKQQIYQSVEDSDGAWHCGDGRGAYGITNKNSIGIEMCCNDYQVAAQTEANAMELVRYLQAKYNVPDSRVLRHFDASRKMCPNWSADGWARWTNFKNVLAGGGAISGGSSSDNGIYYRVVSGSYANKDKANERLEYLNTLGHPGFLDAYNHNGTTMYRVIAGSFIKRDNAEKVKNELIAEGQAAFIAVYQKKGSTAEIPPSLPTAPTTGGSNPAIVWDYQYDAWVAELQDYLNDRGAGIAEDGIAGNGTYAAIKPYKLEQGETATLARLVQRRLTALGFGSLDVDGIVGPNTWRAINEFQRYHGLGVGYLGGSDWYYLIK